MKNNPYGIELPSWDWYAARRASFVAICQRDPIAAEILSLILFSPERSYKDGMFARSIRDIERSLTYSRCRQQIIKAINHLEGIGLIVKHKDGQQKTLYEPMIDTI